MDENLPPQPEEEESSQTGDSFVDVPAEYLTPSETTPEEPAIEAGGAEAYPAPEPTPLASTPPQDYSYTPTTYPPAPTYYQPSPARPVKDRGLTLILEILPGLFGFLGIGWIYAGNTTAGIIWLVGFLFWNLVATVLDAVTLGFFLCVHLPVNIACLITSPVLLNNYIKQHPEVFGR